MKVEDMKAKIIGWLNANVDVGDDVHIDLRVNKVREKIGSSEDRTLNFSEEAEDE